MRLLLLLLFVCLPGSIVDASISVEFQFGTIKVPAGTLGVIVADTGENGFENPSSVAGVTLDAGNILGTDDVIVATFSNRGLPDWSGGRGFSEHFAEIDYEDLGVAENQEWILYVFPERSAGELVRTGEPHVLYRATDFTGFTENSSMSFVLPADGGAYLAALIDESVGGEADLTSVDISPATLVEGVGRIERELGASARHTYYFEMTSAGFLSISGSGNTGMKIELYRGDGQLIAEGGDVLPFFLEEDLEAGFHTLVVYQDSTSPGPFDYEIDFDSDYIRFVRPDVAVGRSLLSLSGAGEFFAPGPEATLISRKARRVIGIATVGNLGERPEALAATASRGNGIFRVSYRASTGNVTGGLISGTYRTPVLSSVEQPIQIVATVSPRKKAILKKRGKGKRTVALRKKYSSLVVAKSTSDESIYDGGWFRVYTR